MFLNIKKIRNTYIVDIQVKNAGLSEGIVFKKKILELAMLISEQNRHIVLSFNNSREFHNIFVEKLILAGKFCAKNNVTLSFCGVGVEKLSVFYLLKFDEYFEFYEDKYDAVLRKNRLIKRRLQVV